jgi:hypothetical protein
MNETISYTTTRRPTSRSDTMVTSTELRLAEDLGATPEPGAGGLNAGGLIERADRH